MKKPARDAASPAARWKIVAARDSAARASLSPVRLEQLAVLATFYDGLGTTPDTIPPGLFASNVKLSRVLDGGEHRFDMWTIGPDAGCLFWRDDKEPVGLERMQGGWEEQPKKGWVVRGLKLDLRQLAWDLDHLKPQPASVVSEPRPAPSKPSPMQWRPRRQRRDPEDCG